MYPRLRAQQSRGPTIIFALEESPIETKAFTIPLQQVRGRSDPYTFDIELGGWTWFLVDPEVSVGQCHSRVDHINDGSLELLGSRSVVYIEIFIKKLKDRPWEGRLCG